MPVVVPVVPDVPVLPVVPVVPPVAPVLPVVPVVYPAKAEQKEFEAAPKPAPLYAAQHDWEVTLVIGGRPKPYVRGSSR
jgi:hypothetical protein